MASSSFIKRPKLNFGEHLLVLGVFFGMIYIFGSWFTGYLGLIISIVVIAYITFWFWLLHSNTKDKIYQNAIAHFPTEVRGGETASEYVYHAEEDAEYEEVFAQRQFGAFDERRRSHVLYYGGSNI